MTSGRRHGLGRGLDALLSSTFSPSPAEGGDDGTPADDVVLAELPVDAISPNPEQPRGDFPPEALAELTASIRVHGVLQPIVVERMPQGGHRLVAGERRLRAARSAGLPTVPAVIRPASESARDALEMALVENLQRVDLSPIDEATAFSRLADAFGLTDEAIGLRVGRSRSSVSNAIRLLQLPPEVQAALRDGRLTAGHGRALLPLGAADRQRELADRAIAGALTVRDVEALVHRALDREPARRPRDTASPAPAPTSTSPRTQRGEDDAMLARALEHALGTPVRLERRAHGGRIVVDFYDDEQLDDLYRRMGGRPL